MWVVSAEMMGSTRETSADQQVVRFHGSRPLPTGVAVVRIASLRNMAPV